LARIRPEKYSRAKSMRAKNGWSAKPILDAFEEGLEIAKKR